MPRQTMQVIIEKCIGVIKTNLKHSTTGAAIGEAAAAPLYVAGVVSGVIPLPIGAATESTLNDVFIEVSDINSKMVGGTDIGDVTINNGAAAAAVNIQDGGNTITVDGTVNATCSGTVTANAGTNLNTSLLGTEVTLGTVHGHVDSMDTKMTSGNASLVKIEPAIAILEYSVTLTNLATEYSQALPAGTKAFEFKNRSTNAIRFAFTTGKVAGSTAPVQTLPAGAEFCKDGVLLTSVTLYLACTNAGDIVEIITYS